MRPSTGLNCGKNDAVLLSRPGLNHHKYGSNSGVCALQIPYKAWALAISFKPAVSVCSDFGIAIASYIAWRCAIFLRFHLPYARETRRDQSGRSGTNVLRPSSIEVEYDGCRDWTHERETAIRYCAWLHIHPPCGLQLAAGWNLAGCGPVSYAESTHFGSCNKHPHAL